MSGKYMKNIVNYNKQYERGDLCLWLDLSTYCNARCPQCHRTDADGLGKAKWLPLTQWSIEEFKKMFPVETMAHIKSFDMCGTWGEPVMNKDIFKIIKYIMEKSNCTILLNTNGSVRDSEWWWNLGVLCKDRLWVWWAVEGTNQEMHSLYRQDTDLQLVLDNMASYNMAGGKSTCFTVIFKHNQDAIYNIAMSAKDNGCDDIMLLRSNRFYYPKFKFINQKREELELHISTLPDMKDFYWTRLDLYNEKDMERIKDVIAQQE